MSKELETWYKKLVAGWDVQQWEVRFIIKTPEFVSVPASARNVIYWKYNGNYYLATNYTLHWASKIVSKSDASRIWINDNYSRRVRGRAVGRPKKSEPDICKDSTLEEIKQRLIVKK